MVTYGPWVQSDDLTETTEGHGPKDLRQARTIDTPAHYDTGGDDPGVLSAAASAEMFRLDTVDFLTDYPSGWPVGARVYASLGGSTTSPYPFDTWGTRDDCGLGVNAVSAIDAARSQHADSITLPPGASRVELESPTYVAVGADIQIPLIDKWINGAEYTSSVYTPMNVDFYVRPGGVPMPSLGKVFARYTTLPGAGPREVTVDISAAEEDISAAGAVTVAIVSALKEGPGWSTTYEGSRAGVLQVGRSLLLDTTKGVQTTWTIRPPRYRFVYEGGGTSPHLRVIQRGNDGSGLSGGRRILQGRSTQATNRRGAAIR